MPVAISSYSELVAAIRRYFPRSDDITADIDLAIALFENSVDTSFWPQEKKNEVSLSVTAGSSTVTLPSDVLSVYDATISGNQTLRSGSLKDIREARMTGYSGKPEVYAEKITHSNVSNTDVITSALEFYPTSDSDYTMDVVYWMKLFPLSNTQTTNWLLRLDPSLYLYGSLAHIPPRFSDENKMAAWQSMFDRRASAWFNRETVRKTVSERVVRRPAGLI
jgi:hypothetical protein